MAALRDMDDVPAMAIRGGAAYLKVADASRRDIMTIDEINENFALLDEWDDRYRYLIELGRMLPPLADAARIEANKVQGCASQVWLTTDIERGPSGPVLRFVGDSDAHIVRGLIAILLTIYSRKPARDILATDALASFDKLGLRADEGNSPSVADIVLTTKPAPGMKCATPINSGPQHFVLNAAVAELTRWVRHGVAPPHAPHLQLTGPPPDIARDAIGNALGGIRTPAVDAPIASLSGLGQTGSSFCFIFGTTVPFDAATLASLYPDHAAYVRAVRTSLHNAKEHHFLRPRDAKLIKDEAVASNVGQ